MEEFGFEFELAPERCIYSVSELNAAIRAVSDAEFQDLWVTAEISGLQPRLAGGSCFFWKGPATSDLTVPHFQAPWQLNYPATLDKMNQIVEC